jgi:hypothetical protein
MVVAQGDADEESGTYAMGILTYTLTNGYTLFSLELEPKTAVTAASFSRDKLLSDSDSIYYYDRNLGAWQGHPRFSPQNINNGKVVIGVGYLAFTHNKDLEFTLVGV